MDSARVLNINLFSKLHGFRCVSAGSDGLCRARKRNFSAYSTKTKADTVMNRIRIMYTMFVHARQSKIDLYFYPLQAYFLHTISL